MAQRQVAVTLTPRAKLILLVYIAAVVTLTLWFQITGVPL